MISLFKKRRWIKTYEFRSEDGNYIHEILKCEDTGELKHIKLYKGMKQTKIIRLCKIK